MSPLARPPLVLSDAHLLATAMVAARCFSVKLVLGQRYMEQQLASAN